MNDNVLRVLYHLFELVGDNGKTETEKSYTTADSSDFAEENTGSA